MDQLSFPEDAARAVRALLGDVVLCDNLDDALEGHARDAAGLRFATPDGCIVWPSGKVTLGATAAEDEEGALARARRLEDARVRHGAAQEALAQALAAAEEAEEALRKAQAESLALSQELAQKRGAADAARAEADRAEEKLAAVRRELEDVERQRAAAEQSIAETRPNVDALAERVDALARELEETKEKLAAAQDAVAPLRDEAQRASRGAFGGQAFRRHAGRARDLHVPRARRPRARDQTACRRRRRGARDAAQEEGGAWCASSLCSRVFEELVDSARRWTRDLEDQATAAQDSTSGPACGRERGARGGPCRRRPPSTRRTSA